MIRRFNYTDRIRIPRVDVTITLRSEDGKNLFDADLSKLDGYHLPKGSSVFIEAYRTPLWMRFTWGSIGALVPPEECNLAQFGNPEGIHFRVKVTASGDNHKLLAVADGIPLVNPEQIKNPVEPLLPVRPSLHLNYQVYRVIYDGHGPVLEVNNRLGDYTQIVYSDPFMSLAIPAIYKEILSRIVLPPDQVDDDEIGDRMEDEMGEWEVRWMEFTKKLPGVGSLDRKADIEERIEWIDAAVDVFARRQRSWGTFLKFWRREE